MDAAQLNDAPLYNSKIIDSFLQLIKRKYSYVDIRDVLKYAGMKEYEVADQSHWFTQKQVNLFYERLVQVTGNPQIAREAGRYAASPGALGAMRQYILGLADAASSFEMISNASAKITRSSRYESRRLASNKVEVVVTPVAPGLEQPFQCENRIGFFEAMVLIFNHKIPDLLHPYARLLLPEVQHPECMFRGGAVCRYVVSWQRTLLGVVKKVRDVAIVFLAVFNLTLALLAQWTVLQYSLPLSICAALTIALVGEVSEKRAIRASLNTIKESIDELLNQIDVNYNNSQMVSEIGQGLGTHADSAEVLASAAHTMGKRLEYDRGFFLLADEERVLLHLTTSYGYSAQQLAYLDRIPFRLRRPWLHGICVRAFLEQRPFLVNDVQEGAEGVSPRALAFARKLGMEAFICAPIICEGSSIGVLVVDYQERRKPLVESDVSLLMGIASVIGISLRNTELLADLRKGKEELEVRVAQRTEELQRSQNELRRQNQELQHAKQAVEVESQGRIDALEKLREQERMLVLQSRQAALGEMLSNIAHQWRQPLNILGLIVQELPVMLSAGRFTPEYLKESVGKAMEHISYMSRTIDDLRNLFKPDAVRTPFKVSEALDRTLSLVKESFKNLQISVEVHPVTDPVIRGYPNEFSHVLLNILFNARDALVERNVGKPKTVVVTVDTIDDKAVVTVADNAGGIPEEIVHKVFDPYFTTKGPERGTGLGLYMCKTIIEKNMQGKLSARNIEGGAEFRVEVALDEASRSPSH